MTIKELEEYGKLTALYYEFSESQLELTESEKKEFRSVKRKLFKISDFILSCKDPLIKQLMILKFFRFMSWESISKIVGGYNSADSCRMLIIRYINRENKNNNYR